MRRGFFLQNNFALCICLVCLPLFLFPLCSVLMSNAMDNDAVVEAFQLLLRSQSFDSGFDCVCNALTNGARTLLVVVAAAADRDGTHQHNLFEFKKTLDLVRCAALHWCERVADVRIRSLCRAANPSALLTTSARPPSRQKFLNRTPTSRLLASRLCLRTPLVCSARGSAASRGRSTSALAIEHLPKRNRITQLRP